MAEFTPEAEREAGRETAPAQEPTSEPAPSEPSLIDAGADLVESVVDYVRQETGDLVHDKVVVPLQKAGGTVALALAIASALIVGILFIAAGLLALLGQWLGWPAALLAVGGVLVCGAAVLAYVRTRSMQ